MRPLTYLNPDRDREEHLTALDLRVLLCIGWHDRLSKQKGSAGCFAGNARMAAEVGCTVTSLSRSINHLIAAGLVERDYQGVPGRQHMTVYRVIYDNADADDLASITPLGNYHLSKGVNDKEPSKDGRFTRGELTHTRSFTRASQENGRNTARTSKQETPLNGGIDSAEAVGKNSSEEARLAARADEKVDRSEDINARLERIYGSIKAGDPINRVAAEHAWLTIVADAGDEFQREMAELLAERLLQTMNCHEIKLSRGHREHLERYGLWAGSEASPYEASLRRFRA
jgi:hypothetical protein